MKGATLPLGAKTSHRTPHSGVWCVLLSSKEAMVIEPEETLAPPTRRRAPGADPAVRSFGAARTCAADGCETKLSRYNPDSYCSVHRGWDRQVVTRRRRGDGDDDEQG